MLSKKKRRKATERKARLCVLLFASENTTTKSVNGNDEEQGRNYTLNIADCERIHACRPGS